MTSPFTDERDRIEQALTFDTGCEPSAQEIIDALSRAGYQITPGPGYDHSGNDNHLVAGDHGPVITPQAGEWQQECGSIGLQHQCGRCGCEYRSPPPQAGEAEPVAWRYKRGPVWEYVSAKSMAGGVEGLEPLFRHPAPPSPVAPVWQPTHRHVENGSLYQLLGTTKIRTTKTWCSGVLYRNELGEVFTRFVPNFNERFVSISPLPSPPDSPGAGDL